MLYIPGLVSDIIYRITVLNTVSVWKKSYKKLKAMSDFSFFCFWRVVFNMYRKRPRIKRMICKAKSGKGHKIFVVHLLSQKTQNTWISRVSFQVLVYRIRTSTT